MFEFLRIQQNKVAYRFLQLLNILGNLAQSYYIKTVTFVDGFSLFFCII